jgi:phosphate transport system permease protein
VNVSPATAGSLTRRVRSFRQAASVDRLGDGVLYGLCALAALLAVATIGLIAYEVTDGATLAISHFGLGFLGHTAWQPNFDRLGAGVLLYGTAVTSLTALLLATPIGVAIGLYLALLAPGRVRAVVGPLVELLAAIPSVILGFWGILILAPFLRDTAEPWLHSALGFIPLFGAPQTTGIGLFNACLILTIMVVPIIASISRDLFLTVPRDLQDGAAALGATQWEVVRGVILPSAASGVAAAAFLGLGRALGEAIAVSQVTGAGNVIDVNLFNTGDTLASRIAGQFQGAAFKLQKSALFYLAVILLVIGLLANLLAQGIARRFAHQQGILAR